MNHPLVSVCVVTRNQARFIRECLSSVLEQAKEVSMEILIGDDESGDGTSEIVAAIASTPANIRVVHLRHPVRIGPSANVRSVMRLARGRYIARLDGDDYWLPGKLARQIAHMESVTDCVASFTQALLVSDDGRSLGVFNDLGDARLGIADLVRHGNLMNSSSLVFRSEAAVDWLAVEGEFLDYRGNLCLARRGWLDHIGEPFVAYRLAAQGSLVAAANEQVRELYWEALRSVPADAVNESDLARGMGDFLRRVAFRALRTGDPSLLARWWRVVTPAAPVGKLGMATLLGLSVVRAAATESIGRLNARRTGRGRVLYRK